MSTLLTHTHTLTHVHHMLLCHTVSHTAILPDPHTLTGTHIHAHTLYTYTHALHHPSHQHSHTLTLSHTMTSNYPRVIVLFLVLPNAPPPNDPVISTTVPGTQGVLTHKVSFPSSPPPCMHTVGQK